MAVPNYKSQAKQIKYGYRNNALSRCSSNNSNKAMYIL